MTQYFEDDVDEREGMGEDFIVERDVFKEFADRGEFDGKNPKGDGHTHYDPSVTATAFHNSSSRWRAIMGPVGSGKSVACVMEVFIHAVRTPPINGVRYSRVAVVRSTFAQLKSTTIPTFRDWLGNLGTFRFDSPISFKAKFTLLDNTQVNMEVWFMPLENEKDISKLRSLEVSMFWLNEGSMIVNDFTIEMGKRLRYLSGKYSKYGVKALHQIIIDTNPPPTSHWIYEKFELIKAAGWTMFRQPGALIRLADGTFEPNPLAENIENLPDGYDYYFNDIETLTLNKINTLILANYGSNFEGKPVYDNIWSQTSHTSEAPLHFNRAVPLIIGMDWGLYPAAVFMQMTPTGTLQVLDELTPKDVTLETFLDDYVMPKMINRFPRARAIVVGDPAGMQRASTAKHNAFDMVRAKGFETMIAPSQDIQMRRDAVGHFLMKRNGFSIDKQHCSVLIEGFDGGYRFEKLQGSTEFKLTPEKSQYSHPHDALQYGALYYYQINVIAKRNTKSNKYANMGTARKSRRFIG